MLSFALLMSVLLAGASAVGPMPEEQMFPIHLSVFQRTGFFGLDNLEGFLAVNEMSSAVFTLEISEDRAYIKLGEMYLDCTVRECMFVPMRPAKAWGADVVSTDENVDFQYSYILNDAGQKRFLSFDDKFFLTQRPKFATIVKVEYLVGATCPPRTFYSVIKAPFPDATLNQFGTDVVADEKGIYLSGYGFGEVGHLDGLLTALSWEDGSLEYATDFGGNGTQAPFTELALGLSEQEDYYYVGGYTTSPSEDAEKRAVFVSKFKKTDGAHMFSKFFQNENDMFMGLSSNDLYTYVAIYDLTNDVNRISKFDNNGMVIVTRTFDLPGKIASIVALNEAVYVTGSMDETDMFVMKLTKTLVPVWTKRITGFFGTDIVASDMGVYAVGWEMTKMIVLKLNSDSGASEWSTVFGQESDNPVPNRLAMGMSGLYLSASKGTENDQDAIVVKLSFEDGSQKWGKKIDTPAVDIISGLEVEGDILLLTGSSTSYSGTGRVDMFAAGMSAMDGSTGDLDDLDVEDYQLQDMAAAFSMMDETVVATEADGSEIEYAFIIADTTEIISSQGYDLFGFCPAEMVL